MPYISGRRPECNTGRPHPPARRETILRSPPTRGSRAPVAPRSNPIEGMVAEPCEVGPDGVEYLVRAARVTDIDRVVALERRARCRCAAAESPLGCRGPDAPARLPPAGQHRRRRDAASRRRWCGPRPAAVGPRRRLRRDDRPPGRRPGHDADRITEALLEELLRSASNKGCTVVEAERPDDPAASTRWARMGFAAASPRIQRTVTAAGSAARRTS